MSLKIEKIETSKHKIKNRALMEQGIVPPFPSIVIFSASQGGGKTTLLSNMLRNPLMYGKSMEDYTQKELRDDKKMSPKSYFDQIFLLIGSEDDMYEQLVEDNIIKQNHVAIHPTFEHIQTIIDAQEALIQKFHGDMSKVPKILIIFDDVVNDQKLMRSKPFLRVFVAGRHINASVFLLSQYLNLVPKACRLQANYLFVFKFNRAELQVLTEQYCPPSMTKAEFANVCYSATESDENNKNNFLTVVKRASEDKQFRKNLDIFLTLKRLKYVPKLEALPSKKELADTDFDNEMTIREISDDLIRTKTKPRTFEPEYKPVDVIHEKPKKGRPKKLNVFKSY